MNIYKKSINEIINDFNTSVTIDEKRSAIFEMAALIKEINKYTDLKHKIISTMCIAVHEDMEKQLSFIRKCDDDKACTFFRDVKLVNISEELFNHVYMFRK